MKVEQKASDLRFRIVGKRVYSKQSRRSVEHGHSHSHNPVKASRFQREEVHPLNLTEVSEDESAGSRTSMYKYSAIEDTRVSRFTQHQILLVQKNILVLTLLIVFFGMIKIEADVIYPSGDISNKVMLVLSCCTGMLILLVILRKVLMLQLQIDQRKVYIRLEQRQNCTSSFLKLFRDKQLAVELIVEVILILPHPCSIFQGVTYNLYDENQGASFNYSINDLLSVLMMTKIYLVFRSLVAMTAYSSPRAVRLCSYNHIEHGFFFSIKCIQHQYPLAATSVVFAIITIIFSFGFRVTEGNLHYLNPVTMPDKTGFEDYATCLWYTFITMTSIGYGQYFPITTMGRLLASIISIFGVVINSFIVVALSQYLKMKTGEIRSHTTLERLSEQKRLYGESAGVLAETISVTQLLSSNKLDPMILRRMKPVFEDLKKKIDITKSKSRQIKAILPQQNKTELMIHEFQLVKDSFKELFNKQRKIKQKIGKVQTLKSSQLSRVRQSFLNEIQTIVQKYNK